MDRFKITFMFKYFDDHLIEFLQNLYKFILLMFLL